MSRMLAKSRVFQAQRGFQFSRAHGAGGGQRAMLLCFPRLSVSRSAASEHTRGSVLLPGRMQEGLSLSQLNSGRSRRQKESRLVLLLAR